MFLLQELAPIQAQNIKYYRIEKITPEGVFNTHLSKSGSKLLEFLETENFSKTLYSKNPSIYNIKINLLFEGSEEDLLEFLLVHKPEIFL